MANLKCAIPMALFLIFISWQTGIYCREYDPPKRTISDPNHEVTALRDGKEMAVHLKARETKQYSFQIGNDDTPFWLTVIPCGGTIKWRLAHQQMDDKDDATGEEGSGYENKLTSTSKYDAVSPSSISESEAYLRRVSTENSVRETTLVREVGRSAMEYVRESMPGGTLHLYLTSADDNATAARVFVTTDSAKIDDFLPKLPSRQRLTIWNITAREISLSWDPSPSVNFLKQNGVKYCVVLSAVKEHYTYCEIAEEEQTRRRKENHPKNNKNHHQRHGARSQRTTHARQARTGQQSSRDSARAQKNEMVQQESVRGQKDVHEFVQFKTEYKFGDLSPDTKYHLSLFLVNTTSGGSAAYEGASFVTRSLGKNGRETVNDTTPVVLQDGRIYASYLNPARAAFRLYEFHVAHYHTQIFFSIQPCSGYIRLNIYKDGELLRKSVFGELKIFVVTRVYPGVIRIKVVNDDNDAKIYKIWSSVHSSRYPYPVLPPDTSIKSFENGRTCNNVTLAWLGTTELQDYCLYKKLERDDYFKQLILEESNQCQGPAANMEKVFCRRVKVQNETELVIRAVVQDLKPATTYRFDLYASKPYRQQLSYRTIWVKTKRNC